MDRIWLKNYPAGIPADIDVTHYSSVVQIMEESFQTYADRKAYVCMDKFMTFRELDSYSAAVGAWLQAKGLKKGDRVAIMLPNILQFPVCFAAVVRAGFVAVCVNPLYTPRELQHQLKDSGAKAIFILENFGKTLEPVVAQTDVQHIILTTMGDMLGFPKGLIVNTVVRHVKKMVPAFSLPTAIPFKTVLAEGAGKTLSKRQYRRMMSLSCNIPVARQASPRGQRSSTAMSWPMCCKIRPGSSPRSTRSRRWTA